VVMEHATRRIIHLNVTAHPTFATHGKAGLPHGHRLALNDKRLAENGQIFSIGCGPADRRDGCFTSGCGCC